MVQSNGARELAYRYVEAGVCFKVDGLKRQRGNVDVGLLTGGVTLQNLACSRFNNISQ